MKKKKRIYTISWLLKQIEYDYDKRKNTIEGQEMSRQQIVAEVSKTWREGAPPDTSDTISSRFELVLETNRNRGYVMESWRYGKVYAQGAIYETIVAVFTRLEETP